MTHWTATATVFRPRTSDLVLAGWKAERVSGQVGVDAKRLHGLLPSIARSWLIEPDAPAERQIEATVLSADISGFTRLAEQLAQHGARESSEALTEAINQCFSPMIEIIHAHGGDVLKFGGDALFVLFENNAGSRSVGTPPQRACLAASAMQAIISTIDVGVGVPLSMTVGVATGSIDLVLAGTDRRELLVFGATVTECLQLEDDAERGEVLVCAATAAAIAPAWIDTTDDEVLALHSLESSASSDQLARPIIDLSQLDPPDIPAAHIDAWTGALGDRIAAAVDAFAGAGGELRVVNVAFVLLPAAGRTADELSAVIERTFALGDRFGTTLIGVDVYRGGLKLLIASGTPTAGGDDEDALLSTVSDLVLAPDALPMRAGINRGLVYTGFLGSDRCQTFTVMGDAVNLAARLLGKADLGSVVVSDAVLTAARGTYETVPLPPLLVRGRTEPVMVHQLGGRTATSAGARPKPAFVGRTAELALLHEALERARQGEGRAIELVGESGIGISRLAEEFIGALPPGILHFDLYANIADRGVAFSSIRPLLRALASIPESGSVAAEAQALQRWVARIDPQLAPFVPLIASAFGIEVEPTAESERIAPRFRETRTIEIIIDLLSATLVVPTVIYLDSGHLADHASVELRSRLAAVSADRPWLIIVSRRTGTASFASDHAIIIPALTVDEAVVLISSVADLPDNRRQDIAERSDGNPLFALELVAATRHATTLPESIEALMTARIDRLGHESRSLVRTAAVVGTDFRREILTHTAGASVVDALREIADFFDMSTDGRISFRSKIARDVAYEGLSARRRREVHAAVAAALEEHGGEVGALAWHHDQAGHDEESWRYSMQAAAVARDQGSLSSQADHLARAIAAAERSDQTVATTDELSAALVELFHAADLVDRDTQAAAAADRALDLIDDPLERVKLMCRVGHRRAEVDGSFAEQAQILDAEYAALEADGNTARTTLVAIRAWIAATRSAFEYRQGETTQTLASTDHAIADARAAGEKQPLALALILRHAVLADQGRADDELRGELIAAVDQLGDESRTVAAHSNIGEEFRYRGDWLRAMEHYEVALKHAEAFGDARLRFFPSLNRAAVLLDQGHLALAGPALDGLRRATAHDSTGYTACEARRELGRFEVLSGQIEAGRKWLGESLEWAEASGSPNLILATRLELIAADLTEGRSADVLAGVDALDLNAAADLPITMSGRVETLAGYAHLQQGNPELAHEFFVRAVSDCKETNPLGHALALVGRSEAETFLGRNRAATKSRATAQEILDHLGVVALPTIPLPR